MGRVKTSSIWAFYSQEEGAQHLARCKSCSKVISRGKAGCKAPNNGGMLNHLQRIHKEEYDEYKAGEEGKKAKDVKDEIVCLPDLSRAGHCPKFLQLIDLNQPI